MRQEMKRATPRSSFAQGEQFTPQAGDKYSLSRSSALKSARIHAESW
jgi:hypothetical protein